MTKVMPGTKQQVRYQWIRPILERQISIEHLIKVCPFSERTIKYWLSRYRAYGMEGLIDKSTVPHTFPTKTKDEVKDRILLLRDTDKIGGKKIYWQLGREGVRASERVINKILKAQGRTRKYAKKREYIVKKKQVIVPGELVEIDIKYGIDFGFGRWWYQYTAIDVASKWRYLRGYENRQNDYSISFLNELMERTERLFTIKSIKTDNDAVFTNRITGYSKSTDPFHPTIHALDALCQQYGIIHYLIAPGKPTQNGCVERSHRTDNDYFYKELKKPLTLEDYNYKLRLWNNWYNDLPHCSLHGLSPNEYLARWVQYVRA